MADNNTQSAKVNPATNTKPDVATNNSNKPASNLAKANNSSSDDIAAPDNNIITSAFNNISGKIKSTTDSISKRISSISTPEKVSEQQTVMDSVKSFFTPKTKPTTEPDLEPVAEIGRGDMINTDNYIIVLGVFLSIMLVVILYFFSKTFNVSRTLDRLAMYQKYQKINNFPLITAVGNNPLKSFHIASAYNACHSGSQMLSYTSELVLKQIICSGARYVEFNIFASKYGPGAIPVIDSGYAKGEWKLMMNTTTFESAIKTLSENAFTVATPTSGAPNNSDPLFIGLNLSTGFNTNCLNLIADILLDYFNDRLLDPKYAYQFTGDFANIKLKELENKVVIFASTGFEGSKLEELVNATWVDASYVMDNIGVTLPANKESFANPSPTKLSKEQRAFKESLDKDGNILSSVNANGKSAQLPISEEKLSGEINKIKSKNTAKLSTVIKEDLGITFPEEEDPVNDIVEKTTKSPSRKNNQKTANGIEKLSDTPNPSQDLSDILVNDRPAAILRIPAKLFGTPGFDGGMIRTHNETGLSIVVPHVEGDYITRNYDPQQAFELGCQFVAMNYQEIDTHMDTYITKFETAAILEK